MEGRGGQGAQCSSTGRPESWRKTETRNSAKGQTVPLRFLSPLNKKRKEPGKLGSDQRGVRHPRDAAQPEPGARPREYRGLSSLKKGREKRTERLPPPRTERVRIKKDSFPARSSFASCRSSSRSNIKGGQRPKNTFLVPERWEKMGPKRSGPGRGVRNRQWLWINAVFNGAMGDGKNSDCEKVQEHPTIAKRESILQGMLLVPIRENNPLVSIRGGEGFKRRKSPYLDSELRGKGCKGERGSNPRPVTLQNRTQAQQPRCRRKRHKKKNAKKR